MNNADLETRVAKLRSFKKPEEIHDFLLAEGIRGKRVSSGSGECCPMARYLQVADPTVRCGLMTFVRGYNGSCVSEKLSGVTAAFAENWDAGGYPLLEEPKPAAEYGNVSEGV